MKLCKVSWPSAAESRDGLVESCTCRCRHRGGSPSHPGHDPPVGSDPTPRLDHGGGPRAAYTLSQRVPYLLIAKRNSICTLARARVCIVKTAAPPPHAARKSKWNASTRNNTKARFLMSFHEEFVLLVSPFVLHWMRHRREVHSYLRLPATWFIRKSINLIESSLEQLSRVTRSAK